MIDLSPYKTMVMHHDRIKFKVVNEEALEFLYKMVVVEGYSWGYITQVYFYGSTPKLNKLCKTNKVVSDIKEFYMEKVRRNNRAGFN
jgi:hypothetical protein